MRSALVILYCVLVTTVYAQWELVQVPLTSTLNSVHVLGEDVAIGSAGYWLKGIDGIDWTAIPLVDNSNAPLTYLSFSSVHQHSETDLVGIGTFAGLNYVVYRSTDGGITWTNTYDQPVALVMLTDQDWWSTQNGLAVGTNGRILHTSNGGSSWLAQNTTSVLLHDVECFSGGAIAVGESYILRNEYPSTSWEVLEFGSAYLRSVSFVDENIGYAAGSVLLKTVDGGSTWNEVDVAIDDFPFMYKIKFISEMEGYAVSFDRILYTSNGGVNWEYFPVGPALYDIDIASNGVGYAVGEDGSVYRTTSEGVYHPYAHFTASSEWICQGSLIEFVNHSAAGLSLQWYVDGELVSTGTDL